MSTPLKRTKYVTHTGRLLASLALAMAALTSAVALGLVLVLGLSLFINWLLNWARRLAKGSPIQDGIVHSVGLQGFSREVMQTLDLEAILAQIGRRVEDVLHPVRQWVWLYDERRTGYVGRPIGDGRHAPFPAILVPDGALAAWLREHRQPLYLPVEKEWPTELSGEWAQMRALGAVVYAPLYMEERLCGWLALGPRRSGQPYRRPDLAFLTALVDQAAPAVENARLYASVRHKLASAAETKYQIDNVFSSIASGVITTDVQDRVVFLNRAAETILEIKADDAMNRPCHHVLRLLGSDLQYMVGRIKRGESPIVSYEVQPELPTRGPVWVRVAISALKDSRSVTTGVAIVVDDLTERRQLEARARRIRSTFERYVSPAVVERLLSNPADVRLGGVRREVTSFYADIRGFTAFSENTSPEFQIEVLNKHLTLAVGAILAHEGTLDKFVGDGAMAIFNAPVEREDHTMLAIRAALAMQRAVREHHARVDEGEQLHFGIGITVGQAVVGNIGAAVLHNFTAIGDCVNVSNRLSSVAEPGQVLISVEAYERVKDQVEASFIGHVQVKGHSQPEPIYEVLGLKEGPV